MAIYSRSPAQRYAIAAALVLLAILVKLWLERHIGHFAPFWGVLTVVLLAAWFGGRGPGLLATGLCAVAIWYFFLPPYRSLRVDGTWVVFRLGIFAAEGTLISLVVSSIEEARRSASETRLKAEVLRDVSQEINERVRTRADRQQALVKLYQWDPSDPEGARRAVGRMIDLLGAYETWLLTPTPDGRALRRERATGEDEPSDAIPLDSDTPEARAFLAAGQAAVPSPEGDGWFVTVPSPSGPQGVLAVRTDRRRSFTREDQDFLRDAARALGDFMARSHAEAESG